MAEYKNLMKLYELFSEFEKRIISHFRAISDGYAPRNVRKRIKRSGGGYTGSTKEYRDTVLAYWKKYGIKPKRIYYTLLCAGKDAYDPRFIPDPIWMDKIIPYFNWSIMVNAYADKNCYSKLLPDAKKPDTLVKNMAGVFYNGDKDQLITREEAERILSEEEHLIFKPSLGTKGAGIMFYDRDAENGMCVSEIMDIMGHNYLAQRIVKQHPDLARLNPSTLNTLRILSFRFKGEVYILSAQLRIGGAGARVDNVSAGGSACSVYPNGWLHEQSVTRKSTWTDETANGIKLNSIHVPNYEGVKETVRQLHSQLPYFNIVGWDFAVGEDGTPIMIEFNTRPGQNQIGDREPTFGDMTDEVLDEVFIKKTLKNAFKRK